MADRALTVHQPWADLIIAGVKDTENRTWPPPSTVELPLRIGVHAGKQFDKAGNRAVQDWAYAVNEETRRRGEGPLLSPIKLMMEFQRPERRGVLVGFVTVTGWHYADKCDHICPEAGCDDCSDPLGHCGHDGAWPAIDTTGDAIPCDVRPGEPCNNHCSRWAEPDVYHWELADPEPLDSPIPMRGHQRLWTLPDDVTTSV